MSERQRDSQLIQQISFRCQRRVRSQCNGNSGGEHFGRNRPPQREQVRTGAPNNTGAGFPNQLPTFVPETYGMDQDSPPVQHAKLVKTEDLFRGGVVGSLARMDEERRSRRSRVEALAEIRLKRQ